MRRISICLLLFTFAFANLVEASGRSCCRAGSMPRAAGMRMMAMPCCPPSCSMRGGKAQTPPVPESSVALCLPDFRPAQVGMAAAVAFTEPPSATVAALRSDRIPARPPRSGLALRSTLLI